MKIKRSFVILMLLFLFCITTIFSVVAFADNENYEWSEISLESYYVGDTIKIPVVTVKKGEEEYQADFTLKFPDGKVYSDDDNDAMTESKFILPYAGVYQLTYSTLINGKYVSKSTEFTASERLFSVSSAESSLYYGEVEYSVPDSTATKSATGLYVKLVSGDIFRYNKLVDLTKMPSLATIMNFYVLPNADRELDVSGITVILTDAYDASNTVEIKVKARANANTKDKWDYTYLSACAPNAGQVTTGYSKGGSPEVQVDTVFGAGLYFSFYGSSWGKELSALDRSMDINFNNAEKAAYVGDTLVVDLDDPFFFSNLWGGFTTGEVFVSVVGNTYYKESVNLLITELCGQNLGEDNFLTKESEPEFYVDANGIDLNSATTVLGYQFPVFNVTAVDPYDGSLPVSVKAFNGYYSSVKNEIDIVDGYFTANKLGVVTLEYSVKSYSGNVYKKLIDVLVKEDEIIGLEFIDGYCTDGISGDIIPLADYAVSGNIGSISSNISVTLNGTPILITDNTFKPTSAGTYTVAVEIVDVIGQSIAASYNVRVANNPTPVFFGDVIVPKYFIVGKTYKLPVFEAYDYADNQEKVLETKVFVNGVEGNTFTPAQTGGVEIQYVATTDTGSTVKKYMGEAIVAMNDDQTLIHTRFFDCNGLSAAVDTNGINFTSTSAQSGFTFVNYLSLNDFSVEFTINPNKAKFAKLNFCLTDILNAENKLKFSVEPNTLKVYMNDTFTGIVLDKDSLFDTTGKTSVAFTYDARSNVAVIGSSTYEIPEKIVFNENMAIFGTEFEGIESEAEFSIRKLCNQAWKSTIKKDNMSPMVSYNGSYDRYVGINTELTLFKATFSDVLNPLIQAHISVKGPNGYLTSTDGVRLEKVSASRAYTVLLDNYGVYDVEYYAEDFAGKKESELIKINVIDKEAPTVTIHDATTVKAKLGDIVRLPDVSVSDNVDQNLEVSVIVYTCYTGFRKVLTGPEFEIREVSDYIVTFICYDSAGNMGTKSFTVKVEG